FRDEDNSAYSLDPLEKITPGSQRPEPPGPHVAIINQSFADHFFEGRNPIGMHVAIDEQYRADRAYEIVGVVKDVHSFGLRAPLEPMLYFPVWRPQPRSRDICIRTSRDVRQLAATIQQQVTAIDPGVPVLSVRSMHQQVDQDILVERLIATLSSFFGLLALLLAAVGLYGVIFFRVSRRV